MVAGRVAGQTPYTRLEQVLRESGIQITPTGVDPDPSYDLTRGDEETEFGHTYGYGERPSESHDTFQDGPQNGQSHVVNGNGEDSQGGNAHVDSFVNGLRAAVRKRRASDTQALSQSQNIESRSQNENRLQGRAIERSTSDNYEPHHRRPHSVTSISLPRDNEPSHSSADGYSADESEYNTESRRLDVPSYSNPYEFMPHAQPSLYGSRIPSPPRQTVPVFPNSTQNTTPESSLQSELNSEDEDVADAFIHNKTLIAVRRILWQWRNRAIDAHREHARLDQTAEDHDSIVLLRNAMAEWRDKYMDRRRARLAQEFLERLDEQATAYRRECLLKKALFHWREEAHDARSRTEVARRHLLRSKYFNHWRHLTAVNELKTKRPVLKRYFALWRRRMTEVLEGQDRAVLVYQNNLVKRAYSQWLRSFRIQKFQDDAARRFARIILLRWRDIARQLSAREEQAIKLHNHDVQRKVLTLWAALPPKLQNMETTANDFRYRKLIKRHFGAWKTKTVLAPKETQITAKVDRRALRTALLSWNHQAQLSRHATQVHEARIMRNCFTTWNDQLRTRCVENRIDSRVRAEAFYKWLIATRTAVSVGERDVKIGTKWFHHLLAKAQARRVALDDAARAFATIQRQKQLRLCLSQWRAASQTCSLQDVQAIAFRSNSLLSPALTRFQARMADVKMMDNKADAARFFFLTTSALKSWKAATQQNQKLRRRDAYIQVRRKVKTNLAREMLRRMQDRLAQNRAMERAAEEQLEDHAMRVVISSVNAWRYKTQRAVQFNQQAEATYQRRILQSSFIKLRVRHEELQRLDQEAQSLLAGSQAVEAINCLRSLDRRLFQIRGQEQWAQALRDKHGEKHVKNMLRYWAERAAASRRRRAGHGDENSPPGHQDDDEDDDGRDGKRPLPVDYTSPPTQGAWASFDPHLTLGNLDLEMNMFPEGVGGERANDNFAATPLPGYLKTPSKRHTAKTKARERVVAAAPPPPVQAQPPIPGLWTGVKRREPPATAPARQPTASALPTYRGGGITPFERKLQAQGYPKQPPRNTDGPSGAGTGGAKGARLGFGRTPAKALGFAGFEDIPEDERSSSRQA
jgi:protein SFI1